MVTEAACQQEETAEFVDANADRLEQSDLRLTADCHFNIEYSA